MTERQFVIEARTVLTLHTIPVEVVDNRLFTCHAFCQKRGITWDREAFWDWLPPLAQRRNLWSMAVWEQYRKEWERSQDYRDLMAADRHDDGEGLRYDPHFDACIG